MKGKFENYNLCLNIWNDYRKQISQKSVPKNLCHYTDTEVLDSILEHAIFWASNIRYMNDFGEYEWGARRISKNTNNTISYDDLEWFSKKLFSISFAGDNDSLHQWLTYAKESGVCIELDRELLWSKDIRKGIYFFGQEEANSDGKADSIIAETPFLYKISKHLRNVQYKAPTYTTQFDHELAYSIAAAYAKNPAFKIENESRAIFYAVDNKSRTKVIKEQDCQNDKYSAIRYCHKSNGVLRPYMKIAILKTTDGNTYEPCIPIKSIIVGPSGIQQTIFDAVVHRCKYGTMKVNKYDGQALCDRLSDFMQGAIQEWESTSKTLGDEQKNRIVSKLLHNWYNEYYDQDSIYKFIKCVYCDKSKCGNFIYHSVEALADHDLALNGQEDGVENDYWANRAYEEIVRDNFFTAEGIWIKKSRIPYLYS